MTDETNMPPPPTPTSSLPPSGDNLQGTAAQGVKPTGIDWKTIFNTFLKYAVIATIGITIIGGGIRHLLSVEGRISKLEGQNEVLNYVNKKDEKQSCPPITIPSDEKEATQSAR